MRLSHFIKLVVFDDDSCLLGEDTSFLMLMTFNAVCKTITFLCSFVTLWDRSLSSFSYFFTFSWAESNFSLYDFSIRWSCFSQPPHVLCSEVSRLVADVSSYNYQKINVLLSEIMSRKIMVVATRFFFFFLNNLYFVLSLPLKCFGL